MSFDKRLQAARKEKNITIEQLAEKCNTSDVVIRNYLKARRIPNIDMLARICNALDVSPDYLLQDDLTISGDVNSNIVNKLNKLNPRQKVFLDDFIELLKNNY